jgi:hypothetical protein
VERSGDGEERGFLFPGRAPHFARALSAQGAKSTFGRARELGLEKCPSRREEYSRKGPGRSPSHTGPKAIFPCEVTTGEPFPPRAQQAAASEKMPPQRMPGEVRRFMRLNAVALTSGNRTRCTAPSRARCS